ncbi:MarR family transcriptional regulator [Streptomyces sp. NPDC005435]|uniref:MarR family winged helix-turn-helix transcriptional regulator n=1 Tax=Streptomyces sp. NPDC005435 TaxID=3154464 RepID=UPI003454BAB3
MNAESSDKPSVDVLAVLPRLAQLTNALNRGRLAERATAATGLSLDRPAVGVLVTLRMADRPLRVGEIAERMQVVGPHVTRQVQELERRSLVRRIGDPHDRRASLIEPTPEGTEAANRYAASLVGWFSQAIADWSDQDRDDLGRLLGRLVDDVTARMNRLDTETGGESPAAG